MVITRDELSKMNCKLPKNIKVIDDEGLYDTTKMEDVLIVKDHKAVRIKNGKRNKLVIDYSKSPKDWSMKKVRFTTSDSKLKVLKVELKVDYKTKSETASVES